METENRKKRKVAEGRWGSSTKDQQKCSLASTRNLQDVYGSTTSVQHSEIHSVEHQQPQWQESMRAQLYLMIPPMFG